MALVTRSASASPDASTAQFAPQVPDLLAGEVIDAIAPCYIKTSDGLIYMSNGTGNNEAAEFVGFSARACAAGEPITLLGLGTRFRYGTALGPGDKYFVAATPGRLDTAATVGGLIAIARAVNATDIVVISGGY